jgi:hypothetical protein
LWHRGRTLIGILIVVWMPAALVGAAPHDEGIEIRSVDTTLINNVYWLNANIEYIFSNKTLEALNNGVPITIELDIEVSRHRDYLWDETIATLEQRYQLQYHALTKQYLLKNLNSTSTQSHASLRTALAALGNIVDFPMLDKNLLDEHQQYTARMRASVDIEALPVPLRLLAYVTSGWRLSSEWYEWSLKP